MQIRNRTLLPTGKDIRSIAGTAECHRPLLTKVALQLGISRENAQSMVESAIIKGSSSFLFQNEGYTLKTLLVKILVRDCIFKLSMAYFSEEKVWGLLQPADTIWLYNKTSPLSLSARLVYILCDVAGFDEYRAAQILNSSSARVKGDLGKARSIVTKPANFIAGYKD